MDDDNQILRIRRLATSIIGYHLLAENEDNPPPTVRRLQYEAIVAGSAVPLAEAIVRLFDDIGGTN